MKVLKVAQPAADYLTREVARTDEEYFAEASILLRSQDTRYRGDVLIVSTRHPEVPGHGCGETCGLVELVATKRASDLTEEERKESEGSGKYAWVFRNPRRVIEEPARKDLPSFGDAEIDVMCYPRVLRLGSEGYEYIRKRIRTGK